ncbi:MAG TPA: hypothetical protein VN442_00155 [Bryobacteraceae bacterium]|nr:hypothetical protein [Bryobacteraceae bacterium]
MLRNAKRFGGILLAATLLSAAALAADNYKNGQDITGSWKISVTIPPGSSVCPSGGQPCVIFAMATATSDGTVIQTAAIPGTSNGHGVWVRTGLRQFLVKSTYFRLGQDGQLIGTSETVTRFELDSSGLNGSGSYENTLMDIQGNIVGTFSGAASAKRIVP